jgi:pimeloyl-ACP methyl ester carboxylesterase
VRRHARDAVELGEPGPEAPHAGGWDACGGQAREDTARVTEISSHTIELDEQPVHLLRAGDDGVPILYLHGVPTSADDWLPFLRAAGGIAVDLPGFGRSGKRGDGDFTADGWARWIPRLLDALDVERVCLCAHDWGAAGLVWAAREPARVARVAVLNGAPLVGGLPLARVERALALPGVGEMAVGLATPRVLGRILRRGMAEGAAPDRAWFADVGARFDQGTQRAVLRLLRAATPEAREAAGRELRGLDVPALVVHGGRDPWRPPRVGDAYAAVLPASELRATRQAGHWPWLEDPALVGRVVEFLRA